MRDFFVVARRPRWIAGLLLALAIAGAFAALGQWQLERSFASAAQDEGPKTEIAVPLTSITEPQTGVTETQLGQKVTVTGTLAGDLSVLSDRNNGTGSGYWLIGRIATDEGASLAVALGWAADLDTVEAAAASDPALRSTSDGEVTGRYLPSEAPPQSDFEEGQRSAMAVPQLINEWPEAGPAYGGYLVVDDPVAGLEAIISPEPIRETGLNLLNAFYAVEWVLFAGFAIYLWYRVVRDVVENEREEASLASAIE